MQLHPPEILEARRTQLGIADCVLNISVPEVVLNGSRIVAVIREFVATSMAKHIKRGLGELVRGGAQYIRWDIKRSGPLTAMRGFSQFRRDRGFLSRAIALAA